MRFLHLALLVSSNNAAAANLFDTELTPRTVKDTVTELDEQFSIPMYEQSQYNSKESSVATAVGCISCSYQSECVAVGFGHCIDGCCGDYATSGSGSKSAKPTGSMVSAHILCIMYSLMHKFCNIVFLLNILRHIECTSRFQSMMLCSSRGILQYR